MFLSFFPWEKAKAQPKRELRAVWIATVANIDWPSQKGLSANQQREELVKMLDFMQQHGFNAVVLQVRPSADAFYASTREPWSEWLSGKQGTPPQPYYDPLAFAVAECHRRGLELHAWINPFRARLSPSADLSPQHIANTKPEWILPYGKGLYLDPGLPAVRQYVKEIVAEIAANYDVDAIHFDDYFYPYPSNGQAFPDQNSFAKYAKQPTDLGTWRRENVNQFIAEVHDTLRFVKPYVKFGISPPGIWRNQQTDARGSATNGFQAYDQIYADALQWLEKGWVDYLVPQLYWSRQFQPAAYDTLLPWWAANSFQKHLYIGHAAYKIDTDADKAWKNPVEIPAQIQLARRFPQVQGSMFFSAKVLMQNRGALADSLKATYYQFPALVPAMPWLDDIPPYTPSGIKAVATTRGTQLNWWPPPAARDGETAHKFALYRFPDNAIPDPENPVYLMAVLPAEERQYLDTLPDPNHQYVYAVAALDRLQNESEITQTPRTAVVESQLVTAAIYPEGGQAAYRTDISVFPGIYRLVFRDLPQFLKPATLSPTIEGDAAIIGLSFQKTRFDASGADSITAVLADSVNYLEKQYALLKDSLEVLAFAEEILKKNQQPESSSFSFDELRKLMEYLPGQLLVLKGQQRVLSEKLTTTSTSLGRLKNALNLTQPDAFGQEKTEVILEVSVQKAGVLTTWLQAAFDSATWEPSYRLTLDSTGNALKLDYLAEVRQATGQNWQEVSLTLATKPNVEADSLVIEENKPQETPMVALTTGFPVSLANGATQKIWAKTHELPVTRHYQANALDNQVQASLLLANWRAMQLLPGKATWFAQNILRGETLLQPDLFADTLKIDLGKTQEVLVQKITTKGTPVKKLLGLWLEEEITVEIVVKNISPHRADVQVTDMVQALASNKHKIKAAPEVIAPGRQLSWRLALPPGENKTIRYSYVIKYPKTRQKP